MGVRLRISALDTTLTMSTGRALGMRLFLTVTTWTMWFTVTHTTRTVVTAMTTVLLVWWRPRAK